MERHPKNLELLVEFFEEAGCRALGVSSIVEFDSCLQSGIVPTLALVDVAGMGEEVWARCRELSRLGVTLVVVSPKITAKVLQMSAASGAKSVLEKPLSKRALVEFIRALAEEE